LCFPAFSEDARREGTYACGQISRPGHIETPKQGNEDGYFADPKGKDAPWQWFSGVGRLAAVSGGPVAFAGARSCRRLEA
jgi:hypothetical protein